jgi:predicted amidohydrolase
MFKAAAIQLAHRDGESKEDRIKHAGEMIDRADGAQLVLLPEAWNVGWWSFDQWRDYSEPIDGETVSRIAEKAKKLNAYILAGSIIERDKDGNLYNSSVLLDPKGKIVAHYRKIHLVGFRIQGGLSAEEKYIAKRGEEPVSVKTELGVLGLTTCYDLRFPELYRKLALEHGVEVFLLIAAWTMTKLDNWRALTQARANENLCWLVSCGGCGVNRGAASLGYSSIINPNGIVTAQGGSQETIVKGEIDIREVYALRKTLTALDDRVL